MLFYESTIKILCEFNTLGEINPPNAKIQLHLGAKFFAR